jgi:hypothetical protein
MRKAMLVAMVVFLWMGASSLLRAQTSGAELMLGSGLALTAADSPARSVPPAPAAALCHYDLWFQPRAGMELIVKFEDLWENSGAKKSKRFFEAEVAWTFESAGKHRWTAQGRCLSAHLLERTGEGESATRKELRWSREKGLAKGSRTKAGRHFAQELSSPFAATLDRRGAVRAESDELFFTRGRLIHASRLGFAAPVAGRRVVPSATWTSSGDLLGRADGAKETARFRIDKVTREGGERIALVQGSLEDPREQGRSRSRAKGRRTSKVNGCKQKLWFNLSHKFATRSELVIAEAEGQRKIVTQASWRKIQKRPAQLASLRSLRLDPIH